MNLTHARADFPQGFMFGASTSSYQIEGSALGGCGPSQWDVFAATPGNVVGGENGARACEHYLRWRGDLDLLKAAKFDLYRFSISWARVLPEGRGRVNQDGLDFYDALVDGLLERGIEPIALLYHWDLPAALSDLGGWTNPDIAGWFADYAEIVMMRLGDRLFGAASVNEPWCISWLGHYLGLHAPGLRSIRAAVRAMHYVMLAHGRGVEVMRSLGLRNIGLALNFEYPQPADESEPAIAAAKLYDGIYNRWFVQAAMTGGYPEDVAAVLEPYLPKGHAGEMKVIAAPIDWLGVNYYTRKLIAQSGSGLIGDVEERAGELPKTTMGWEIYPQGLTYFLERLHRDFTGDLPLIVTENGMSSDDRVEEGAVADRQRIDFFDRHLGAVVKAIAGGVPVKGYMVWSLLDNFEWGLGYDKRFGLVHVDFETQKRTPKASFHALARALG